MEASIVAEQVDVREKPAASSPILTQLAHGVRVVLGDITFKKTWVNVHALDGRHGFIAGDTPIRSEPMSHWLTGQTPWEIHIARDAASAAIASPAPGTLVACGAVSRVGGVSWTEVALRDGQLGYIRGEPIGDRLVWAELPGRQVPLHDAAGSTSTRTTLHQHNMAAIGPPVESGGKQWARAILPDGTQGFLAPATPIVRLDPAQQIPALRTMAGTCALCRSKGQVHLSVLHIAAGAPDSIHGVAFVPACEKCLKRDFRGNLAKLALIGAAGTGLTFAIGLDFIGMVAFAPLCLYFMNTMQSGSAVRRYRQFCTKACAGEFAKHSIRVREPVGDPDLNQPERWAERARWIICPGCLTLHREQAPWCPHCGYLFCWRISPLI